MGRWWVCHQSHHANIVCASPAQIRCVQSACASWFRSRGPALSSPSTGGGLQPGMNRSRGKHWGGEMATSIQYCGNFILCQLPTQCLIDTQTHAHIRAPTPTHPHRCIVPEILRTALSGNRCCWCRVQSTHCSPGSGPWRRWAWEPAAGCFALRSCRGSYMNEQ